MKEAGWRSHQLTWWPGLSIHTMLDALPLVSETEGTMWATTEEWSTKNSMGCEQFGSVHYTSVGSRGCGCGSWQRLNDKGPTSANIMGFLWNWNGISNVIPSWGLSLYWQLHLQQDDLVLGSCCSFRTSGFPLGLCPCLDHLIRCSRSDDTVPRGPGQRVPAATANLGHVSSCLVTSRHYRRTDAVRTIDWWGSGEVSKAIADNGELT